MTITNEMFTFLYGGVRAKLEELIIREFTNNSISKVFGCNRQISKYVRKHIDNIDTVINKLIFEHYNSKDVIWQNNFGDLARVKNWKQYKEFMRYGKFWH